MSYCVAADLYSWGLPRGALPNPGRLVDSVSSSANTVSLDVHGFEAGDPVSFRAESGGSLPAPLVAGTTYYAVPVSGDVFSVAATAGGEAIDFSSAGARIIVIAPLPIASAIAFGAALIDDMLPGHVLPLIAPYPPLIVMTNAELAAGKLLARTGSASKSLTEIVDQARKRLERWALGIPVRGENVQTPANLAASASVPYADPRGWNRWGGI